MFNISDKVVCVDDTPKPDYMYPVGIPAKGQVHSVEYASESGPVWIVGFTSIHLPTQTAIGFDPDRFRKLSEVQAENQLKRENEKVGDHREAWERQMDAILKRIQQL